LTQPRGRSTFQHGAAHGRLRGAPAVTPRRTSDMPEDRTVNRTAPFLLLGTLFLGACERRAPAPDAVPHDEPGAEAPLSTMRCDIAAPPAGVATVQVVFSCDEQPVGTWRPLPAGAADSIAHAVGELLGGPTREEAAAGLTSFFSGATAGMLNGLRLEGDVVYVDFANFSQVVPNASSSAGSAMFLDQIAGTLFQFDGVREAVITFDGSCEAFWNWLQRGCQRLTRDEG
jgi:hypothetical protein